MPRLFEQFCEEPKILPHAVIRKRHLGCDAALGVAPPVITKVHHRRMPAGHLLLMYAQGNTGLNIRELYALCAEQRKLETACRTAMPGAPGRPLLSEYESQREAA